MNDTIDKLTLNYEEDGVLLVKETGKEVLSKGALSEITGGVSTEIKI